jgi:hypothetical protein
MMLINENITKNYIWKQNITIKKINCMKNQINHVCTTWHKNVKLWQVTLNVDWN